MAGPTVYKHAAEEFDFSSGAGIFVGKKFWVAQRVPSRSRLLDDIRANGGEIVQLEKMADYRIADHFRPTTCAPGTISYTFVEKSIKDGELQDPADHRAGPPLGEVREPASVYRPTKSGRAAYTAEEDRILYKWVRDAQEAGAQIGGNEIYMQLEAKYPRHTWQSWRDRYHKQLKNRPPSAFNIPDNAPPSPPSDQSNERMPPAPASLMTTKQQTPKTEQTSNTKNLSWKGKSKSKSDYSVQELEGIFTVDDWLELYAFADLIDDSKGTDEYDATWAQWAEFKDEQTGEQWQQYYEKVVYPQWLVDPVSKRQKIKRQVERKYDEARASESQPVTKDPLDSLKNSANIASEIKAPSSSTAHPESSNFYEDQMERFTKRLRENDFAEQEEETRLAPPTKRRKSESATPTREDSVGPNKEADTQHQPVEISSAESSQSTSHSEDVEELMQEHIRSEALDSGDDDTTMVNLEADPEEKEVESIESDDFPDTDELHPPPPADNVVSDDLPSNTPTPRAARQKVSYFDTQAILSPTQDSLSRPHDHAYGTKPHERQRSSSPFQQLESDASTTQSLEEFRRSLQEEEDPSRTVYSQAPPQPLRLSSSPAPSSASSTSTGSGDPDPPLTGDEIDEFYEDRNEEGWSNDYISKALKRTRMRPELAVRVLEAWKDGNPLPKARGIWSIEDDVVVESGDGLELAMLAKKHSLDGWGGITERLLFLEAYRSYN
ncbi:hypothetical protein AA0119_g9575 [Alternaria tenuissima]|uniref:DNA-binding protein RAP1 n=1 Tax=Alternaria tenuissima TaxID=119927 RepID=A0AB37WRU6_9PLEO|nr:hypothetical protein AA0115_g1969 [Alternaria tenuissima]RYN50418.1 hypothetical protein AA0118_g11031 [Alternaria tenuissima]RYN93379.1 hypothetical protein AA0119_g9575 [Alternaria tenuissima]RYO22089.1 hypothetical protein AA0121_g2733 [Alternaria tenuissima]